MKKRLISLLMAVILTASLLPMPVGAMSANKEQKVRSEVETVVTAYGDSIYYPNADDDAFTDFFSHGFFGRGKKMTLTDESSMTAVLFNSALMQACLQDAIVNSIDLMYEEKTDTLWVKGFIGWHQYASQFYLAGYPNKECEKIDSMGSVATTYIDGERSFQGSLNENDELLELLAGWLTVDMVVKRTEIKEKTAVYTVDISIQDTFDFTGDYSTLADKGYDVSKDKRLKDMGKLLTLIGLDQFDWSFRKSFEIEVQNFCDHKYHAYHWSFDASDYSLHSEDGNGFETNTPHKMTYNSTATNEDGTQKEIQIEYFQLEHDVSLMSTQPWVLELDYRGAKAIPIGNKDKWQSNFPTIYTNGKKYVWIVQAKTVMPDIENSTDSSVEPLRERHYFGAEEASQFTHNADHIYTYRLENNVYPDGSNMVYYSVYDCDENRLVLGPTPMDDHWSRTLPVKKRSLLHTNCDDLIGRDMSINYIGNRKEGLNNENMFFDLRIWENGKGNSTDATEKGGELSPTCTEQGGIVYTCTDCGYTYLTDTVPALGHSYGEYIFDDNASCTVDGTQTRVCTVCGEKETVTAPDTALKHDYKAVITAPTYDKQGYTTYTCTRCGDSYKDDYTDVKQHSYEAVVTEPTCTEQGYTTYTCSECGDSYVGDYTEMTEHTPVIDPAVAPTCATKGLTEGSHCGVCGYVIKKQASIATTWEHTYDEGVVTKEPAVDATGLKVYTCIHCGNQRQETVPALTKPEVITNPFTDVAESDWFYEPVMWAVESKVTGGKTATTFAPYEGCTRAQVVTFLWAANGKPEPVYNYNWFSDISETDWYYKAVLWAVENRITTGVTTTEFGPDQTCTRAQIATFLWAAMGRQAVAGGSEFVDVADTDWYAAPVIWAKEQGITSGISATEFGPNDTCTRAQVVTFLNKVYNK